MLVKPLNKTKSKFSLSFLLSSDQINGVLRTLRFLKVLLSSYLLPESVTKFIVFGQVNLQKVGLCNI